MLPELISNLKQWQDDEYCDGYWKAVISIVSVHWRESSNTNSFYSKRFVKNETKLKKAFWMGFNKIFSITAS